MSKSRLYFGAFAALLLAIASMACNKSSAACYNCNNTFNNPLAPSVVQMSLDVTKAEVSLNNSCEATIGLKVNISGTSEPQKITWAYTGPEARQAPTGNAMVAQIVIDKPGTYDVSATAQPSGITAHAQVVATGSCPGSGSGPNPPQTPHGPACRDGVDNDGDGKVDYPADPGCSSTDDDDETDMPAPLAVCTSFRPLDGNYDVVRGTNVDLVWTSNSATQYVVGGGDWTRLSLPANGQQTITPNGASNTYYITCYNADGIASEPLSLTIKTHEAPAVCQSTVDYTPGGGSLAVGESRQLVDNKPASDQCDTFWGVDRPDLGSLIGSDKVVLRDGVYYPVGHHAVVKRIAKGTFNGFAQPSLVNTTKSWHPWTDSSGFSVRKNSEAVANIMFDVHDDGTVWYKGLPVSQTGPPVK